MKIFNKHLNKIQKVVDESEFSYQVEGSISYYWVSKTDCEIIPEEESNEPIN